MKKGNIWFQIIDKVLRGEKEIPSPFASDGKIESLFVIVQKDTKMGWGLIWCSKTHRGIHLSRMEVPDAVASIFDGDDEGMKAVRVPQLTFEDLV
jgi:hypothetical protein